MTPQRYTSHCGAARTLLRIVMDGSDSGTLRLLQIVVQGLPWAYTSEELSGCSASTTLPARRSSSVATAAVGCAR